MIELLWKLSLLPIFILLMWSIGDITTYLKTPNYSGNNSRTVRETNAIRRKLKIRIPIIISLFLCISITWGIVQPIVFNHLVKSKINSINGKVLNVNRVKKFDYKGYYYTNQTRSSYFEIKYIVNNETKIGYLIKNFFSNEWLLE
ncbi:hypothetical protein [Cohnella soli]|uniref:DUF3592 domain-containing protein n=1 Tax=Cohnella soli TaxID=425005 RepID=A0ABW0HLF8_9BACL